MPGSQLANRLQDLNYRVLIIDDLARLPATVQREMPLLLFVDLASISDVAGAIRKVKSTAAIAHVPIIAFAPDDKTDAIAAGHAAGANFSVGDTAVVNHLSQLLEQALQVE